MGMKGSRKEVDWTSEDELTEEERRTKRFLEVRGKRTPGKEVDELLVCRSDF